MSDGQRITQIELELKALWQELRRLKSRFDALYPERTYCPHCKALVHKAARSCAACGKSWGKEPDPNAGLPR